MRRLEALRRAGIAERLDADRWEIPKDFLEQAAAYATSSALAVITLTGRPMLVPPCQWRWEFYKLICET